MGVYKRRLAKGVRWYYSGQYLGTKYFSKAIYLSERECKRAEAEKLKEMDEKARHPEKRDMKLIDLMDSRLDWIQVKKSKKYYLENKLYFKRFLDFAGRDIMASQVTKSMINDFLIEQAKLYKKNGHTNHKVNAILRLLKALFNYGIEIKDIPMENPCRKVQFYPVKISLKYVPKDEEIQAVMDTCTPIQRLLLEFCLQTGCRAGEALRFKSSDIDGDSIVLWTRKAKNSNFTPRRIPRPDCLADYQPPVKPVKVFGEWVEYEIPRFLERRIKKLKQPTWSFHNLRHRACSLWMKNGMPLYEIMVRLGHSNIETTQRYCQLVGGFSKV